LPLGRRLQRVGAMLGCRALRSRTAPLLRLSRSAAPRSALACAHGTDSYRGLRSFTGSSLGPRPLLGLWLGGARLPVSGSNTGFLMTALRCRASMPEFGEHKQVLKKTLTWKDRQRIAEGTEQAWWIAAGLMAVFGLVWACVPLYKMYCQTTGQGQSNVVSMKEYSAPPEPDSKAAKRLISVDFAGTVHMSLPWEFVPQQRRVVVGLGETALAFYRAKNNSDKPLIGVSVYHMLPAEAGLYFNKIQCFCFDEQLINPGEEVDLPIFFFIDPLMAEDSRFDSITKITLSYLFFESDSELPAGYEDYMKAVPSTKAPPSQEQFAVAN